MAKNFKLRGDISLIFNSSPDSLLYYQKAAQIFTKESKKFMNNNQQTELWLGSIMEALMALNYQLLKFLINEEKRPLHDKES